MKVALSEHETKLLIDTAEEIKAHSDGQKASLLAVFENGHLATLSVKWDARISDDVALMQHAAL